MIAEAQMRVLYKQAVQQYRKDPNDEEFKSWMNVLSSGPYSDVDAALRRWPSDTTIEDFTHRPKGARMPAPAEVKASIEQFARHTGDKFKPCDQNGCEGGWVRVFTGMTIGNSAQPGGNPVDPKLGAVKRCQCFYEYARRKSA